METHRHDVKQLRRVASWALRLALATDPVAEVTPIERMIIVLADVASRKELRRCRLLLEELEAERERQERQLYAGG